MIHLSAFEVMYARHFNIRYAVKHKQFPLLGWMRSYATRLDNNYASLLKLTYLSGREGFVFQRTPCAIKCDLGFEPKTALICFWINQRVKKALMEETS